MYCIIVYIHLMAAEFRLNVKACNLTCFVYEAARRNALLIGCCVFLTSSL